MLNLNNKKIAFLSDFDGTISKNDFFSYATNTIIPEKNMEPWVKYKKGEISHVEALNLIFSTIRLPENEFNDFIDTIEIEEFFIPTINLCEEKNITFNIVSAGADYYISRILHNLKIREKIPVYTNPSKYSQKNGLEIIPLPKEHKFYDNNLGISKKLIVKEFQNNGYAVIFAGDGMPDVEAAKCADMVFAKDYLIELCKKENVKHMEFKSYFEIYSFVNKL